MHSAPPFVPVIVCGGSGSRLWPLSRRSRPKPFVPLPGDEQGRSPLALTYSRLRSLPASAAVVTVCAAAHAFLCEREFRSAGAPDVPHQIIGEPSPRNTAAAAAVAAARARKQFGGEALLLVLPADHRITNADAFARAAQNALAAAQKERMVLLGVPALRPASGYGYIEAGETLGGGAFAVRRFVEKPPREQAKEMIAKGGWFWNAGIFCFRADSFAAELQKHAPDIFAAAETAAQSPGKIGAELYEPFPNISLDYALMEKTENAAVVAAEDIGWSDIGAWNAIGETLPADADGNRVFGDAILRDCKNCLIVGSAEGNRLIAAAGLENTQIIDGGDAILAAATEESETQTRALFEELLAQNRPQAATAQRESRPWGSYTVLAEGAGYKVKRIDVLPGGRLSLQSHRRRSEHWTTVKGTPTVVCDDKEFALPPNSSCHIPAKSKHRICNPGEGAVVIIEVQLGDYLGEDDITRYEDDYGRI